MNTSRFWAQRLNKVAAFGLAVLSAFPLYAQETPKTSASVVMYHRFGESDYPATNITMEQFETHINEIKTGGYEVLPLPELVEKLKFGQPLADKTLSITIDDGYASIYEKAYPKFKEAGIPFTIFISTDAIDRGYARHLNWKQIKEMAADPLVYIGAHTASHMHMAAASQSRIGDEMQRSLKRFDEKIGYRPEIFAYPYGEASLKAMSVVRGFGMKAAFGQHSGAVGSGDDLYYLPRFALNEKYGDIKRFQMVSKAKSLHVSELGPKDMTIAKRNPPMIGFTVAEEVGSLDPLACFAAHEGKVRVERLWERRVEVRMEKPLPVGRTRLNCTMPAGDGRWRWFGRLFYVAP
ncbi:Predicted xylanase/chitin deacetylase [Candidatus Terasakiella magnetica]|uniref:Chitooligosaccharide deacetylase n=1 Tax=Candidatus Terasakiella magnetica TaxID=1867952 RepID=A0A1C3RGE4_9PROT|nr:polysaccharide deacetylase family protein [Candidatus Terasakiella magnetica]SCA56329.1 Predicted xylanase/chitin deacetylase [Candidatus Terasakiella magnetica]